MPHERFLPQALMTQGDARAACVSLIFIRGSHGRPETADRLPDTVLADDEKADGGGNGVRGAKRAPP